MPLLFGKDEVYGLDSNRPSVERLLEAGGTIREPIAYFFFVGWWAISLGLHISVRDPNVEIHLPFGFIRLGFCRWVISKNIVIN